MNDTPGEKTLTMTVLPSPDMVNFAGKIHGGSMLRLLDQAAYACAARYCGNYVVTLSVDQVYFRQPIKLGELVTLQSQINYAGRTSMEVGIEVLTENPRTREKRHVISCFFTMVSVDDQGNPKPVPEFHPQTENEIRLFEGAKRRKALRLQYEKDHEQTLIK